MKNSLSISNFFVFIKRIVNYF